MIQISITPSFNLLLPRKKSRLRGNLILTFSGYGGQGKTRFLKEKISVDLYKYLKILVFIYRVVIELHFVYLEIILKISFNRRGLQAVQNERVFFLTV